MKRNSDIQLLLLAIQEENSQKSREKLLFSFSERMLQGVRLGASPKGMSPFGIYLHIRKKLQSFFEEKSLKQILEYDKKESLDNWVSSLRNKACKEILDDYCLNELAIEAQNAPPESLLRSHALAQLTEAIRVSGRLNQISYKFKESIRKDAFNRTLAYVFNKIDNYNPSRGKFMNWVTFRFKCISLDLSYELRESAYREVLMDSSFFDYIADPMSTFDGESPSTLARTIRFIEEDSKGAYRSRHIRNRPDANFREIFLARLNGESWDEISNRLYVPIPTLSSFFIRNFKQLAPKIREEVQFFTQATL